MKPAHLNTEHPPGQIRPSAEELKGQQTLSDYIRSINKAQALDDVAKETKLTFNEWWTINGIGGQGLYEIAKESWNAALTKGKL